MAGHSMNILPEQKYSKRTKRDSLIHSSSDNFQPGLLPNNKQKADEMHVTPSYSPMRM
jgi:hypothetical protein